MTRFLRLRDVCEIFGVSTFTIRNWVEKGTFPQPIRKGLFLRWPEDEIERLIERLKDRR
jgi:predicted DNA-binding transcriptional regulator AlpA